MLMFACPTFTHIEVVASLFQSSHIAMLFYKKLHKKPLVNHWKFRFFAWTFILNHLQLSSSFALIDNNGSLKSYFSYQNGNQWNITRKQWKSWLISDVERCLIWLLILIFHFIEAHLEKMARAKILSHRTSYIL